MGFVTRPIGGIVIGRMGDRVGRKPAMILSFSLMGIAITGLALTPSHAMIGAAAPVLVILFRMVQGFALGGEVGPTTAFLLEAAPPERRGFYTAFQAWTQDFSVLISGLVGFGLASMLSEQQLQDFGWRIAFLLGAAIVPFGLMLRRSLPETFHAREKSKRERAPLRPLLPIAVLGMMLLASSTIGMYIASYMTTYAIATLHMHANVAFAATIVVGLCGVMFDLVSGALSDRIGRKPMMIVPSVLLLVLDSARLLHHLALSHHRHAARGDRRVDLLVESVRLPDHYLADRIPSGGDPLRRRGHRVCLFDRDIRRIDPILGYMADQSDWKSAGARLVLDRGLNHRPWRDDRRARIGAVQADREARPGGCAPG